MLAQWGQIINLTNIIFLWLGLFDPFLLTLSKDSLSCILGRGEEKKFSSTLLDFLAGCES